MKDCTHYEKGKSLYMFIGYVMRNGIRKSLWKCTRCKHKKITN